MDIIPLMIDAAIVAAGLLFLLAVAGCVLLIGTWAVRTARLLMMDVDQRNIELQASNVGVTALQADVQGKLAEVGNTIELVRPDANGLLPVHRNVIAQQMTADDALRMIAAYLESNRTHAPVPHSLTYAPHIKQDRAAAAVAEPAALLDAPLMDVQDFFQLYQSGSLPSNKLLLGFDMEDGQPIVTGWEQLYSCLIGGLSGMGKSTLIRNLLAQSALQGGRFVVLDPHYKSGDESLGASLAPLKAQMLKEVAYDEKTMLSALKFLVETGKRRLSGKDKDRTPLVLIVDETTALLQRGAIAESLINVLEMIAQETRKVNVFAMCIGQNFAAEVMKSTARNSFVSMISCRARRTVARIQADSPEFGLIAQGLNVGQAVWMAPNGEIRKVAVPNTTAEHLAHVGSVINAQKNSSGIWVPTGEEDRKKASSQYLPYQQVEDTNSTLEDGLEDTNSGLEDRLEDTKPLIIDANAERVLTKFYSGSDLPEAITTVYGIAKSGRQYQEISRQIQAILRSQMGGAR